MLAINDGELEKLREAGIKTYVAVANSPHVAGPMSVMGYFDHEDGELAWSASLSQENHYHVAIAKRSMDIETGNTLRSIGGRLNGRLADAIHKEINLFRGDRND